MCKVICDKKHSNHSIYFHYFIGVFILVIFLSLTLILIKKPNVHPPIEDMIGAAVLVVCIFTGSFILATVKYYALKLHKEIFHNELQKWHD